MNAESSPFDPQSDATADELGPILKEAVERIRAIQPPQDVMMRLIERAAGWSSPEDAAPAGRTRPLGAIRALPRWRAFAAVAAVALIAATAGVIAYRMTRPKPSGMDQGAGGPATMAAGTDGASPGLLLRRSSNVDWFDTTVAATQPAAPGQRRPTISLYAGLHASRHLAVAGDATILVSTGGADPIPLGAQRPRDGTSTVHVWDWGKGKESRPLEAANSSGMAVSPDGKWIITADGRLIDAATSRIERLDNLDGDVRGLAFSPDGRTLLLLIREDRDRASARILDLPGGARRFELADQWPHTFACAFSADGGLFFLMDKDRFIRRWDAKSGKELGRYEPAFTNSIRAIAASGDGRHVAGAGPASEIYLWQVAGGKLLHKLVCQQRPAVYSESGVRSLAFSPDGKLLAGGGSSNVVLWDTGTGNVAGLLPSGSGGAVHIRFARDGKKLTTVGGFYGANTESGDILQGYPQVRQWDLTNTVGSSASEEGL